jgi:hypothetical protein
MNGAHLHLMFNHAPVIGALFVLPLLAWALFRQRVELVRLALAASVGVGIAAVIVYVTGEPAEHVVEQLPGVAEASVEAHEAAATVSLGLSTALAVLGLLGLWRLRAASRVPTWLAIGALAGVLTVALSMVWTATLGGLIRHPETAGGFAPPPHEISEGTRAGGK